MNSIVRVEPGYGPTEEFVGLGFENHKVTKEFWSIRCPCGIEIKMGLNEIPTTNTKHPCGDPNHWIVKYGDEGVKSSDDIMDAVRAMGKGTR